MKYLSYIVYIVEWENLEQFWNFDAKLHNNGVYLL